MRIIEVNSVELWQGDCLELMKNISDKSIDMILCDLPYGTTACNWDIIIPFEPLWEQYERIIKDRGAILLFGSQPFTSELVHSNLKLFKYEWIWKKSRFNSGFAHAKNKPLKKHENIVVFSKGFTIHEEQSDNRMIYNPQGLIETNIQRHNKTVQNASFSARPSHRATVQKFKNYPSSVIEFDITEDDYIGKALHPCQKPVELLEYLIKTYTNEGDMVLDNCMGSGSTGVACKNTGRDFIGIELDENYFNIAKKRIGDITLKVGKLF